jgi:CheY-like chemotaxis protein
MSGSGRQGGPGDATRQRGRSIDELERRLRDALAALGGCTEILRRRPAHAPVPPEVRDVLERRVEELEKLLAELLEISRDLVAQLRAERRRAASGLPSASSIALAARRPSGRRVLIVDDERDAAAALAQLLEADGYRTLTAHDGTAALEAAEGFQPHMALLDLQLPRMDGYEVARRLRANGCRTVLIAVTGCLEDDDKLRDAGFDHLLTKPIDFSRLSLLLSGGGGGPAD